MENGHCIKCGNSDIEIVQDESDSSRKTFICRQCHTKFSEQELQQAMQSEDNAEDITSKPSSKIKKRRVSLVDSLPLSKTGIVFFFCLVAGAVMLFAYCCTHSDSFLRAMLFMQDLIFEPLPEGESSSQGRDISLTGYLIIIVATIVVVNCKRPFKTLLNVLLKNNLKK